MYNIEVKYYDEENSRNLAFYPSIKNDEEKIIPAFFILNHLKENILPVLDELFYNLSPVNRMIIKDEINIESDILNSFSINKYSFSIITKNIIPSINYNDTIIFNIDFYFQTINPVDLKG
jgi:5-formyltetrahydrofolate cyclo-ligase